MKETTFIYRNGSDLIGVFGQEILEVSCQNADVAKEMFRRAEQLRASGDEKGLKLMFDPSYALEELGNLRKHPNGRYYLKNVPGFFMPNEMIAMFKHYLENELPTSALENFWTLLCMNPSEHVRESLFKFANHYEFPITSNGYFIGYKAVRMKDIGMATIVSIISELFTEALIDKFSDPRIKEVSIVSYDIHSCQKLVEVFNRLMRGSISIIEAKEILTGINWTELDILVTDEEVEEYRYDMVSRYEEEYRHVPEYEEYEFSEKDVTVPSITLHSAFYDLIPALIEAVSEDIYTDIHSGKTSIVLGRPCKMERGECDSNPNNGCSSGLHVGTPEYVLDFGKTTDPILSVLVNPMNVVSVPSDYSFQKLRCSEYFPFAVNKRVNNKLKVFEAKYFENDYKDEEVNSIEEKLEKLYENVEGLNSALEIAGMVYSLERKPFKTVAN